MIQQRVRLSDQAHQRIAKAQQVIGLARFDEALGYFLEGALANTGPGWVSDCMKNGQARIQRTRKGKRSSRAPA